MREQAYQGRAASQFQSHPDLGIDHIVARIVRSNFAPHAHDEYLIGVTTEGVETISQGTHRTHSVAGQLRLIDPGEVHAGGPGGEAWSYQAIYVPPRVLQDALGDSVQGSPPTFGAPVVDDPGSVVAALHFFLHLRHSRDPLEREERLAHLLGRVVRRHGGRHRPLRPSRPDRVAIARVRDQLEARFADRITLAELADGVGLSRFHLLREFKAVVGRTPWQYQAQRRVDAARLQLRAGESLSQVAHGCGFVDQSHFTRVFRQIVGVTPGVYAASFRAKRGG